MAGRLFLFDAASFTTRILKVRKNSNTQITELINYEEFCGIGIENEEEKIKEVSVSDLKKWKDEGIDFQLIDVRQPYEYDIANLGGELIPQSELVQNLDKISKTKKVIIHCRSGKRSADAIRDLQNLGEFENLYNLKGGILEYSKEIDSTIPLY